MSQDSLTDATPVLRPIASSERIQALDVVRGIALIGIFLMNIEWYSRPIAELGMGLPSNVQGADWWAGYLIYILVQGKFWTMFSLLFGMGFAVMLTRAERAGRDFLVPYIRRIVALAAFGAFHHIFLWAGDILFSYAVGAALLLTLLWARWWAILLFVLVSFGVSAIPGMNWAGQVGFGVAMVLLASLFLRSESRVGPLPSLSLVFLLLGGVFAVLGAIAGVAPMPPADARWPMLIGSFFFLLLGYLSARYKDPVEARPRRLGGTMYVIPFCVMLSFGLLQVYGPQRPIPTEAQVAAAMVEAKAEEAAEKAGKPVAAKPKAKDAKGVEAKKTPVEEAALREARNRINRAEHEQEVEDERKLMTTGSYADFVRMRASEFVEHMPGEFGFSTLIIGMFLLGYWFVRTGIMEHPAEHLPVFRKMAAIGIPLGVGLGIAGSLITTHQTPGMHGDPYQIAMSLAMLGNLPACLGYVGLIVLLLHGNSPLRRISVMAPLGRMALTNYLTHSLVCSLYFYGYAGNHYGMGRAMQVGFVFGVIALQVVFCHLWLSKFRYGPMEWLWRAITYWQLPAMLREREPAVAGRAAA
jgi:uncharacterized membrane protein YeiB